MARLLRTWAPADPGAQQEGVEAAVVDRPAYWPRPNLTERPSVGDHGDIEQIGQEPRLVLRFEWLTLLPTKAPLPVSSQRRDIAKPLKFDAAPVVASEMAFWWNADV
jgi:hypothetical protein